MEANHNVTCAHCGLDRQRAIWTLNTELEQRIACDCNVAWQVGMLDLGLTPARKHFEFAENMMEVTF